MEIELADHFDRMNKVVAELLKGNNPTQIATLTGLKRSDVVDLIDEWKAVVYNDNSSKERAKEAISGADKHYSMLIKEAWKTVEDADTQGQLSVKAGALKLIADIETKRITMLKEVGILDNAEMAAHIAETEHKQEILVKILKEVTASCPKCKMDVARRLSQISGVVEPIEIIEQANDS
jgi:hypothetical protein